MERRIGRIIVIPAGGNAGKDCKTYKISLPSTWVKKLELNEDDRTVEINIHSGTITIKKPLSASQFAKEKKSLGHDLRKFSFFDNDELCSIIYADFTDKAVAVENLTTDIVKTAFGNCILPTWDDFEAFLAERCIPKERSGLREYLEVHNIDEFDTIEIIKKTDGRMAEDSHWIKMEEI